MIRWRQLVLFAWVGAVAAIARADASERGRSVYFVLDDGAGFDMDHASKLFGALQRLHGAHEFSGTGIGLATVQRMGPPASRRVWAESELDLGATVYFTLG